jgi:hypothetical protein
MHHPNREWFYNPFKWDNDVHVTIAFHEIETNDLDCINAITPNRLTLDASQNQALGLVVQSSRQDS